MLIDEALEEAGNPWGIRFMTMFHMSNDSHLFFDEPSTHRLPLYEAKLIHHYDHRWATYDSDGSSHDVSLNEKADPSFESTPRYWVTRGEVEERLKAQGWDWQWLMGGRILQIHRSTVGDCRCHTYCRCGAHHAAAVFRQAQGARMPNWKLEQPRHGLRRSKQNRRHPSHILISQPNPVLPPRAYNQQDIKFISTRAIELTYTAHDLKPWAEDLGYDGPPFAFDPDRRALLRAELDAYYAHLYGLTRDELRYILDPADLMGPDYPSETFRVLKKNELKEFGEYRTQRLVLEAWDRLFEQ